MDVSLIRDMSQFVGTHHILGNVSTTWISLDEFEKLKEKKLIKIKQDIKLPLKLLNYTVRAQFKKAWCNELIIARGLVVREDGMLIARPLPKFFNHYELKGSLPEGPFDVYEKMDGSCIIMGFYCGKPFFCTRGSFTSQQSIKAEEIYYKKYSDLKLDHNYTYCFEIIYPKNKIVVDYGEVTELFLLAKIHTATGIEAPIDNIGFKCVQKLNFHGSFEELKQMDHVNKEGFVVKFKEDNFRIKIKFPTYISLHKKGVSFTESIELLKSGQTPNIPDECFEELLTKMSELSIKDDVS